MLCSHAVLIHDLCINVVKYLITECNCDPMATEHDGSTVLHHAVEQINVLKYLITECNCNPMVMDKDGKTVLHHAVEQINVVKYLIIVYVHNHAYSVHPIFVMILALL